MAVAEARIKVIDEAQKLGSTAVSIAEYISKELLTSEENAALVDAKPLKDVIKFVTGNARKVANNSVAMIQDDEVYGWVRECYGISDLTVTRPAKVAPEPEGTLSIYDLMGDV